MGSPLGAAPGWATADGYPATWRHFVVAMAHLNAERSRETLRRYWAEGMVWAKDPRKAREWSDRHRAQAGWMPYTG